MVLKQTPSTSVSTPWVQIIPSVHQILVYNLGLFEMLEGGPIPVWSESGLEAWDKHIRNFRRAAGCRARQISFKSNLEDIFVRMLIISSPNVAESHQDIFNKNPLSAVLHVEATDDSLAIYSMYLH